MAKDKLMLLSATMVYFTVLLNIHELEKVLGRGIQIQMPITEYEMPDSISDSPSFSVVQGL